MKEQTLMSKFRADDCMDCAYRFNVGSGCGKSCIECKHTNWGKCLCLKAADEKMKRCPYYEKEKKLL